MKLKIGFLKYFVLLSVIIYYKVFYKFWVIHLPSLSPSDPTPYTYTHIPTTGNYFFYNTVYIGTV